MVRRCGVCAFRGAANLVNLDLSLAQAADAFWRGVNFQNADFYGANLARASLESR
jgi:uncharacterized protein YjbI with pentapeptide repeats